MIDLGQWLLTNSNRRRESSVWDCAAICANWAVDNGRDDPMQEWRGAYHNDEEADEWIAKLGGLVGMFSRGMDLAGIAETPIREVGTMAVVRAGEHEAGAIYTGARWALAGPRRGLVFSEFAPEDILKMWAV
jgi:hypothetical protein